MINILKFRDDKEHEKTDDGGNGKALENEKEKRFGVLSIPKVGELRLAELFEGLGKAVGFGGDLYEETFFG